MIKQPLSYYKQFQSKLLALLVFGFIFALDIKSHENQFLHFYNFRYINVIAFLYRIVRILKFL